MTLTDARIPHVRATLLAQLVDVLVPLDVLDDYQSRGVFVNWWETIKYDLKTITSNGWSPTLISEPMVIDLCTTKRALAARTTDYKLGRLKSRKLPGPAGVRTG